jgi:hypothetical protein
MSKKIVSIATRGNSLIARFTFEGKQYRIGLGLPNSEIGFIKANELANEIEKDLLFSTFNPENIEKYKYKQKAIKSDKPLVKLNEQIAYVWNTYKSKANPSETTLKGQYAMIDKALRLFPSSVPKKFIESVKSHYSPTSQYQIFRGLRTSYNFVNNNELLECDN